MPYEQFAEVKGTELFKFESTGDFLEGVLVHREMVKMEDDGKLVPSYHVEKDNGSTVKFLATSDLADKLMSIPFKSRVKITYERDETVKNGQMKRYKVMAARYVEAKS